MLIIAITSAAIVLPINASSVSFGLYYMGHQQDERLYDAYFECCQLCSSDDTRVLPSSLDEAMLDKDGYGKRCLTFYLPLDGDEHEFSVAGNPEMKVVVYEDGWVMGPDYRLCDIGHTIRRIQTDYPDARGMFCQIGWPENSKANIDLLKDVLSPFTLRCFRWAHQHNVNVYLVMKIIVIVSLIYLLPLGALITIGIIVRTVAYVRN